MTTPPEPESPSMTDRLGRYLPDAVGIAKTVQYIAELQTWGRQGWSEAERLEAELAHQIDLRNGTIDDLRAERDEARAEAERLKHAVAMRDASIRQTGDIIIQTTWERDEARAQLAEADQWAADHSEYVHPSTVRELAEALEKIANGEVALLDPLGRRLPLPDEMNEPKLLARAALEKMEGKP